MQIVIPLFDRFTALDAVGPYQVLTHLPGSEVIFSSERPRGVCADSGSLTLRADASFADVPHPDLLGDEVAKQIQLAIEYAPHPPYDAGSPASAPPEVVAALRAQSRFARP